MVIFIYWIYSLTTQLLHTLQKAITFCHLHNPQRSDAFVMFPPISQWYKNTRGIERSQVLDLNWREGRKERGVKEHQNGGASSDTTVCIFLIWSQVPAYLVSDIYTWQSRREPRVTKSLCFMKLGSWWEIVTHISAQRATWAQPSLGLQTTYTHDTILLKVSQERLEFSP